MSKTIKYFLLMFAALLFLHISPTAAHANSLEQKRAVISFYEEVDRSLLEEYTKDINYIFDELPAAAVELTDAQKKLLEIHPGVQSIEYDKPVQKSAQTVPWGYKAVEVDKRVPSALTGKGVKIGILDSGIDTKHPDLKVAGGACLMTILRMDGCKNSYNDDNGHGTHVAGVIAAKNNSIGVVGVAPDAQVYSVKVLDKFGEGTTSTIMAGVEWAIKNKLDVINISITSPYEDSNLRRMIKRAYDSGILVVAAAGNEGPPLTGEPSSVQYPAKFDEVIAVASINEKRMHGPLSSIGKEVELTAPGEKVYSTYPTALKASGYETLSGTSMASPYVVGLAALYKEKYPEMTNKQIRTLLQKNAVDLGAAGKDDYFGYGLAQTDKNPVDHGVTLSYEADGKGKITIDTSEAAAKFTTYNVYRFDSLIAKHATAAELTDYATQGTINYYVHPVVEGKESNDFVSLKVNNAAPALKDVVLNKWYNRFVTFLYYEGIMKGYTNGEMRPERSILRSEAAVLLGQALGVDGTKRSTRFKDVTAAVSASGYVEALAEKKVISGFTDNTFRPNEQVTRAEMAILIARAYNIAGQTNGSFKDINSKVTGYQYINGLTAKNIVSGYEDGTFRPYTTINRASFSAFLAKTVNEQLRSN
ncbi:S8 family serine peptidase [Bacillus aerolatus]|uniref:S8 family serine peptidase n=1 Tax=Bacillus aerolatus TaxID=2653354 RepID=A0A6I1FGU4_9BACI|nr:S8 family serine peptidase [Bacillus aerolatus]KAB7707442.1 S8 family serine peptidase [Bacillus aerolatus]